jgi:hypothetical protein
LKRYISFIREHFPAIRLELGPGTGRPVSFVGELVLSHGSVGRHGFRPLDAGDNEVHFIPMQRAASESNHASLTGVRGTS